MPKGKLTVGLAVLPKLQLAANFSDIQLHDGTSLGDQVTVPFTYRSPSDIFSMGRLIDKVKDEDVKEFLDDQKGGK